MSLVISNWTKDDTKSMKNEFNDCFDDTVERLERTAKNVIEMLENIARENTRADPTNKKRIKEELKKNKQHVNNFKDNSKMQMKEILSTLKLNPEKNTLAYKNVFDSEFDNFEKNMTLFLTGNEMPFPQEVQNIVIKIAPQEEYSQYQDFGENLQEDERFSDLYGGRNTKNKKKRQKNTKRFLRKK
jgi:hypothetical protein